METTPTPDASRAQLDANRLLILRAVGLVLVVAATVAAALLGPKWPVVNVAATTVCWYVGKVVGIPADAVVKYALQAMHPDKAVSVAVGALQSLPPEQAESATRTLLASIPPAAQARVGVVLLNSTSGPPSAPSPLQHDASAAPDRRPH